MPDRGLAVLLLAAGASTRLGQAKQLLPWKNGNLLDHAIGTALLQSPDVFVVLGSQREIIKSRTDLSNVSPIDNEDWEKGMGHSIAIGMHHIISHTTPTAVLIMLVDQPLLESEHYGRLRTRFFAGDRQIVATNYGSNPGVPAIFGPKMFDGLAALDGAMGARHFIRSQSAYTASLPPIGNATDIDTLDSYQELYTHYGT